MDYDGSRPIRLKAPEKQRQARFHRFEKYHYGRNQWIAFKRIAEWLQRMGRPPYDGLVASIHAGRFERGGKSQILFMSRAAIVAPSCGPATIKGCLRFSAADFRVVDHADQDKEVLEAAYLSRFWIPRAVCQQWFIEQGYDLPAWLGEPEATAAKLGPTISSPPTLAEKPLKLSQAVKNDIFKKWREGRGEDVPTQSEDETYMKQFGVGRDQVRGLRVGYPSRSRGAAGHKKLGELNGADKCA